MLYFAFTPGMSEPKLMISSVKEKDDHRVNIKARVRILPLFCARIKIRDIFKALEQFKYQHEKKKQFCLLRFN